MLHFQSKIELLNPLISERFCSDSYPPLSRIQSTIAFASRFEALLASTLTIFLTMSCVATTFMTAILLMRYAYLFLAVACVCELSSECLGSGMRGDIAHLPFTTRHSQAAPQNLASYSNTHILLTIIMECHQKKQAH